MTVDEIKREFQAINEEHDGCVGCAYEVCGFNEFPCSDCKGNHTGGEYPDRYSTEICDNVNHPNHYNREGSMECIDEMVEVFGLDATINFCLLNVWKYRFRAADKNGYEDLKKSDWYMKKYMELKGNR